MQRALRYGKITIADYEKLSMQSTQLSRKHIVSILLRVLRHAYLPKQLTKAHVVAVAYGACIGGFIGGMVTAGMADGQYWWATLLGIIVGILVGAFLALQLVSKKSQ